ncbi:hypothetical protein [Alicyclobacillus fodiniaquatilis]|uniref:Uncharacterized protein n=1 Tax=Alicyclobacillus fodiniaquatilis TaxID=1661150 RepID=A0ABW4JIX1_9BACL
MSTSKFLLSYDEDYDSDIHQIISETPRKRISERLRNLIRLGLMVESQGIQHVVHQQVSMAPLKVDLDPQTGGAVEDGVYNPSSLNEPSSRDQIQLQPRRKKPIQITPPKS